MRSALRDDDVVPPTARYGWDMARALCHSGLIGDDHLLAFLRCESFRPKDAAARLCGYWNRRIEIFGDERAFCPMTLGGALIDDGDALGTGEF